MGRAAVLAAAALLLAACTGIPEGVEPVRGFEVERYLGRWYEIARLDHRFERGLSRVTAEYSRRDDGGLRVVNRGYDAESGTWQEAVGKAYLLGPDDIGSLKVSFFGPFYGGYHVIALDTDYRWAMVSGWTHDYLWLLSREPRLDPDVRRRLVARAREAGFPVGELIDVAH
ncbi:MAG: lipocalin family protein [Gammaproteobacteria bacterium]|nr:lipocalin family protein [Gammaproteobacteria bacterium]